jgi:uncharacterized membrane protein (UPF0127 family)
MKSTNESSSRPSLATLILAVVAVLLVTAAIAVALLPDRDLPAWLLSVLGRQPGLSVCDVKIGNTLFELEIANLKATREQGLKARDSMPADHGMIFVFKDPQLLYFWMKDTRIPLDILYLDERANIISIQQMQPYVTSPTTNSDAPAKWAIELNEHAAAQAGAKPGDHLDIPRIAQTASE